MEPIEVIQVRYKLRPGEEVKIEGENISLGSRTNSLVGKTIREVKKLKLSPKF